MNTKENITEVKNFTGKEWGQGSSMNKQQKKLFVRGLIWARIRRPFKRIVIMREQVTPSEFYYSVAVFKNRTQLPFIKTNIKVFGKPVYRYRTRNFLMELLKRLSKDSNKNPYDRLELEPVEEEKQAIH